MRLRYRDGEREHEVDVVPLGGGAYRATVDGVVIELSVEPRGGALDLTAHGRLVRAWVTRDGARRFITAPGVADAMLERIEGRRASGRDSGGPELASPMPGRVVKLLVAEGDAVRKGAPLLVVEAMKTELTMVAPRDGRVTRLVARVGEMVEAGRPLCEVTAE